MTLTNVVMKALYCLKATRKINLLKVIHPRLWPSRRARILLELLQNTMVFLSYQ